MDVEFSSEKLERLYTDGRFTAGLPQGAVKGFRKAVMWMRAANDERDLYAYPGLRIEQLKDKDRRGDRSARLNRQYRLIFEIRKQDGEKNILVLKDIENHYDE